MKSWPGAYATPHFLPMGRKYRGQRRAPSARRGAAFTGPYVRLVRLRARAPVEAARRRGSRGRLIEADAEDAGKREERVADESRPAAAGARVRARPARRAGERAERAASAARRRERVDEPPARRPRRSGTTPGGRGRRRASRDRPVAPPVRTRIASSRSRVERISGRPGPAARSCRAVARPSRARPRTVACSTRRDLLDAQPRLRSRVDAGRGQVARGRVPRRRSRAA